jgi:hypothetical protein
MHLTRDGFLRLPSPMRPIHDVKVRSSKYHKYPDASVFDLGFLTSFQVNFCTIFCLEIDFLGARTARPLM